MFEGCTAWFSESVDDEKKELWYNNGGLTESEKVADYLFSEDAECEDTQKIFESKAYLDEQLSLFHPEYICSCVRQLSREQVSIGKYYFPPTEIQNYLRKNGFRIAWEEDGSENEHDTQPNVPGPRSHIDELNRQAEAEVSNKGQNRGENQPFITQPRIKPIHQRRIMKLPEVLRDKSEGIEGVNLVYKVRKSERIKQRKNHDAKVAMNNRKNKLDEGNSCKIGKRKTNIIDERRNGQNESGSSHSGGIEEQQEEMTSNSVRMWNQKEVLRLWDLHKVSGDAKTFEVGKNHCKFVDLGIN